MSLYLKQSPFRDLPKTRFRTTVGLSMVIKYEGEAGYI